MCCCCNYHTVVYTNRWQGIQLGAVDHIGDSRTFLVHRVTLAQRNFETNSLEGHQCFDGTSVTTAAVDKGVGTDGYQSVERCRVGEILRGFQSFKLSFNHFRGSTTFVVQMSLVHDVVGVQWHQSVVQQLLANVQLLHDC